MGEMAPTTRDVAEESFEEAFSVVRMAASLFPTMILSLIHIDWKHFPCLALERTVAFFSWRDGPSCQIFGEKQRYLETAATKSKSARAIIQLNSPRM